MQLLRCAASEASCIKYWSQFGRSLSSFVRSSFPRVAYKCARLEEVLSSLMVAREIRGRRPVARLYRWSSDWRRKSSRLGVSVGDFAFCRRVWKRFQRTLTGASTLTKMKNGRRRSLSKVDSVGIWVVTQRSFHLLVTKSKRSSVELNVCLGFVLPGVLLSTSSLIFVVPLLELALPFSGFSCR